VALAAGTEAEARLLGMRYGTAEAVPFHPMCVNPGPTPPLRVGSTFSILHSHSRLNLFNSNDVRWILAGVASCAVGYVLAFPGSLT
jgi:hypothetical protein